MLGNFHHIQTPVMVQNAEPLKILLEWLTSRVVDPGFCAIPADAGNTKRKPIGL
jgi:hypothetical protein